MSIYKHLWDYIEKYFPEHKIRFIAVNDSLDSNDGENDFGPFKNIINEWYAKDISKKIKFSFNIKAREGTLLQGYAPYGYLKCEDSLDYMIDEEVADNIRYIFNSIYNNIPARDVINNLKKNKVYIPGYYNYLKKGINKEKYEIYPIYIDKECRFYKYTKNVNDIKVLKLDEEITDVTYNLKDGDLILMSSDGIFENIIDETALQEYIESIKELPPQRIVYELLNYTINHKIKTKDDMSIIALKIGEVA